MREIKLIKLKIVNFKGIRELEINFDGADMNIHGDNGTGKTSIIDSFMWLLFGKDSLGRADFGIKPTDSKGEVIHQLETSVEAVFDIASEYQGERKTLKKTLSEVWTRKRGAAEAEFTRNENNFYIDGVPKKKTEYTAAIKELIDEEVFKIITNPLYFNESVNWKDRRAVLLTICGEISDSDVIAANTDLAPLIPLLKGKTVADFKEITASAMKRINQELDMIPVKIHEAELAKPNAADLEIDYARQEELKKELDTLKVQRMHILNGNALEEQKQIRKALYYKLQRVEDDFIPERTPEWEAVTDTNTQYFEFHSELRNIAHTRHTVELDIEALRHRRAALSKEWDETMAVRFTDTVCPTCGRELPEEEVEARRGEFNIAKAEKLDNIEKENKAKGADISRLEAELKTLDDREAEIEAKKAELKEANKKASAALDSLLEAHRKEVEQKKEGITAEIAAVESIIKNLETNSTEEAVPITARINALAAELNTINEALANKALIERQDKRIAELKESQTTLVKEYTTAERHLYLAEQFIVAKVNMLNNSINQRFEYAKFKLFDKQINGGIAECCEVTYKGIPYKDLNNAARVNIGLDVINTISAHYGVACPILIDNAESVNALYHTAAQQIRFYVSHDKKLVFGEA